MANRTVIASLLNATAELLREDEEFRFPRGTMAAIFDTLESREEGVSKSGRTTYQQGTVADVLETVAAKLS